MSVFSWFGSLSVRTQWIAILAVWCVVLAAVTGTTAYRETFANAEAEALSALQTDTSSVSAALSSGMKHRRERLVATVKLIDTSCAISGGMNVVCASELLRELLRKDQLTGAVLQFGKGKQIARGTPLPVICNDGSPCFFKDKDGQVAFEVAYTDPETGMTLAAMYSTLPLTNVVHEHWANRSGLFAVVNGEIRALAANQDVQRIPQQELGECISGASDVRGADANVSLYRAYASVQGVQGVCVASAQSAETVLAPVRKLQKRLVRVGLIYVACSIALAWLISFGTTRSIKRLHRRIAGFRADEKLNAQVEHGPQELRELAGAFDALMRSLQKSQAELRQSERRLALAYRAARLWVWEHDLEQGRISWSDPQGKKKRRGSSLLAYLRMIHPEDRASVIEALRRTRDSGAYSAEYRVKSLSGYSWKYSWGQVVKDEASGRDLLVGVTADASSHKEAERLRAERGRLVATTEMAASLAHEINNPLTSVTGALYMAQRETLEPELAKYLDIAQSESQRVVQIVRRLLQVYREPVETSRVDVVKLWRSMIAASEPRLKRKNLNVDLHVNGAAKITGHADELRHGFNNLLTNAMESSPAGSTIRVRISQGTCWKQESQGVRILVSDEGPGIPDAEIANVFEPFVTTKAEKGVGLGLWVTRSAVVKQGGSIRIRSLAGGRRGTCVWICLPAKRING